MSGRYNIRLIKERRSYSPQDISDLLGISKWTCFRWIKKGLKVLDPTTKHLLVMGIDLKYFLNKMQSKRKIKLQKNEYYCFSCRRAVKAKLGSEQVIMTGKKIGKQNRSQQMKKGLCENCNTKLNRLA